MNIIARIVHLRNLREPWQHTTTAWVPASLASRFVSEMVQSCKFHIRQTMYTDMYDVLARGRLEVNGLRIVLHNNPNLGVVVGAPADRLELA